MEIQARRDLRTSQLIPLEVARMPMRVDISPTSATSSYQPSGAVAGGAVPNTLATQVAPQSGATTSVNELRPQPTTFAQPKPAAPTLTEIANPDNPMESLRVDARTYKGGGVGSPGVLGVVKTGNLNPAQQQKIKTEMATDYKVLNNTSAQTDDLLKSIDMLRDPKIAQGLKDVTGYTGVYTPTFKDASQLAQTRLDNLKGKVIALGKASASMTGSIGSIANQEWKILADQIASIDPKLGEKALLEQVQLVEDKALGTIERAKELYARQYGEHFDTIGQQYSKMPELKPRGIAAGGVDSKNKFLQ
jgi:hypothetical protein